MDGTACNWIGERKAPLSRSEREFAKDRSTLEGTVVGAGLASIIGGGRWALLGALLGGVAGYSQDPEA